MYWVNCLKLSTMKLLAIIFLVIGGASLIVMIYEMFTVEGTGDRLTWVTTGPPIIASFCLAAGLA